MSSKNNAQSSQKIKSNEYENKCYLLKDFKTKVSQNDFLSNKEETNKNFGYLDEVTLLINKNNKKIYFAKIIEKKSIINEYQNILNSIYKLNYSKKNINIYDYIINLETQWDDDEKIYLIFDGIKRYCLLDNLIKNNINGFTEENIALIFRQILESINILHENNIYGCNISLDSFIYDMESNTIKFTDLGFSKIFKSQKIINDNKLKNGFEFNEYIPPELINKMNDYKDIKIQDKILFDVWKLGILFYKIASFGKSPYEDAKDEELKKRIINKNIIYSNLNSHSPRIIQIIDKMLQKIPKERCDIKELLNLEFFKNVSNLKLTFKNENKVINMDIILKEKENLKDDLSTLLFNLDENNKNSNKDENNEEIGINNKNLLNKIKIKGNPSNDDISIKNHEIFPNGSVLRSFKNKNQLFHDIDNDLVINLSNKLSLLEKEYKQLDENQFAIYNITSYIGNKIKELNVDNNNNIESFIKKLKDMEMTKIETIDLYKEMQENKEFSEDKAKLLVYNLLSDIKDLNQKLKSEKKINSNLNIKIKEMEKKEKELYLENQKKMEFYEKKIKLLEEVIFNMEYTTDMNKDVETSTNNKLLYQALTNSIKNFSEINIKLKDNLEENLLKFKENINIWLKDIINEKQNFKKEISFILNKLNEKSSADVFEKKTNVEMPNTSKKDEAQKASMKQISELKEIINELKSTNEKNYGTIKKLNIEIKIKDEKISELNKLLNNK